MGPHIVECVLQLRTLRLCNCNFWTIALQNKTNSCEYFHKAIRQNKQEPTEPRFIYLIFPISI